MPLFRKLPQRGFNRTRFQTTISTVNVGELDKVDGNKIDLDSLKAAGLIRSNSSIVKLLGNGEVKLSLEVHVHQASASAKSKIESAGGSVTIL